MTGTYVPFSMSLLVVICDLIAKNKDFATPNINQNSFRKLKYYNYSKVLYTKRCLYENAMKAMIRVRMLTIIFLITIIFLLFAHFTGLQALIVEPINNKLNSFQQINRTCIEDQDCKMSQIDCSVCSPCLFHTSKDDAILNLGEKVATVNKQYKPFCPLPSGIAMCPMCVPTWKSYIAICINNTCAAKKGE